MMSTLAEQIALHAEVPLADAIEMLESPPMLAVRRALMFTTFKAWCDMPHAVQLWSSGQPQRLNPPDVPAREVRQLRAADTSRRVPTPTPLVNLTNSPSNHNHKESTMTTTITANTLTVNGVEYAPVDSMTPPTPSEWRIVIAQRGWVFVGRYSEDGDNVSLSDAKCIRIWGTTKGLGELAASGKTAKTVLDPVGTVRLHRLGVVATLDTLVTTW